MREVIETGAGVLWRVNSDRAPHVEVLIAHRTNRHDWVLPKGRAKSPEGARDAALREMHEETGYLCRTVAKLGVVERRDNAGRWRRTTYWVMTAKSDDGFDPSAEIDERRWVSVSEAQRMLTSAADQCAVAWFEETTARG